MSEAVQLPPRDQISRQKLRDDILRLRAQVLDLYERAKPLDGPTLTSFALLRSYGCLSDAMKQAERL